MTNEVASWSSLQGTLLFLLKRPGHEVMVKTTTIVPISSAMHLGREASAKHPLLSLSVSPGASHLIDDVESGLAARSLTLLKNPFGLSRLVRHVSKTNDLVLPGLREPHRGRQPPFPLPGCPLHGFVRSSPPSPEMAHWSSSSLRYAGGPSRGPSVR